MQNKFASGNTKNMDYTFKDNKSEFNIKGLYNFNIMCQNINLQPCDTSKILYLSSSVN